ncbi:hypothetical protein [Alloprevotella tannerae]|uniref:hypothetical protein n=1 Tax=Alloprevotella tannerae TaxID=76122 RepID=UPI0028E5F873|nr:hypothetical protein [Alloprevotella tannerae]
MVARRPPFRANKAFRPSQSRAWKAFIVGMGHIQSVIFTLSIGLRRKIKYLRVMRLI